MHMVARERFAALMAAADADIDVADAALLISAESYPEVDVARHVQRSLDQLAALADGVHARIAAAAAADRLAVLIDYLAGDCQFRGNQEDYYDRRNSYLNEVLERRIGIPITLAIVYMAVGRRVGLEIGGVAFPGHFLAVFPGPPRTLIDAFHGIPLDDAGCVERLRAVAGPDATLAPAMLAPVGARQIIMRMLANLKLIHFRAEEYAEALSCSERILLIHPDYPIELRDRAALYLQLECFDAARADLERFLEVAPGDVSAAMVRRQLATLRANTPVLH